MMNDPKRDALNMRAVLSLALRGTGRVSPNPLVGCVIVGPGGLVGWGYHGEVGGPHAEAVALDRAGERARGATLYVNLEPCRHHGRTSPCAPRVIGAGIARVVAGMADPDPRTAGGGFAMMREAGVEVIQGVLEDRCRYINRGFLSRIERDRPWVTLKAAATLDGNMAMPSGESRWITNSFSRVRGHLLRDANDAVMVGIGTVSADDPLLTVRDTDGRDPIPVVLDPSLRMSPSARLAREGTVIFHSREAPGEASRALREKGCILYKAEADGTGRPLLGNVLEKLAHLGVNNLLVEGGPGVLGSFLARRLFDGIALFVSPRFSGKGHGIGDGFVLERLADSIGVRVESTRDLDGDLWLEGVNPCSRDWLSARRG
ncbi:MAG TPA: bifunctional diaminohydroxyphosphoribosylaminopyrimidine deaminase/5-amino-6-(5-phosphoribosylamino)uracil reductase RibD [Synergistales bacterium]|nr:bifunctional diaminohydroxyphosphoribosylaminopyrimidine deaminase/5-amino-6-(5-phosphoribosylamino)uracil reductase RibD [Synergistales bacterium]HRS48314.1 bifunctional diaminohydroxyphosphoribosylaminopyrimidine deaminase/5-amino-6-(5-phosphoribosylamino)uracil reductase RibD [Thermovirgaceae bacterium]HRU90456.1 bifunctional diaminohydroxyphosphoribosylaminopyrimidine deaminase/5-amino-6-(5-phosphoribosylamino)uracil reductase RibD [Thermovirgaceae bacterium]